VKILLTGGTGLLGSHLLSLDSSIIAPSRMELDITNRTKCNDYLMNNLHDTIVHCAALTSPPVCEKHPREARNVNISGTINIVDYCQTMGKRLVYISTDYVFDGNKGNYKTTDPINPVGVYSITKAAAELAVRTYSNSLCIRTSFCPEKFPYPKALVDQYTSRDYIDILAPRIMQLIRSDETGIVHVGTERKTVYELASRRSPDVGKASISDFDIFFPKDTSFCTREQ
tara:strand:+ start:2258 stop:2941 length:684 start_codon:yes stop_codon:yes gene_type:complete